VGESIDLVVEYFLIHCYPVGESIRGDLSLALSRAEDGRLRERERRQRIGETDRERERQADRRAREGGKLKIDKTEKFTVRVTVENFSLSFEKDNFLNKSNI